MAKRIVKKTWLPPPDLIQRRLTTLVRLLREEVKETRKTRKGELSPKEMFEWAQQIERIQR